MNIVVFTSNSGGGIAQLTEIVAKHLAAMGHDVTVVAPKGSAIVCDRLVCYQKSCNPFKQNSLLNMINDISPTKVWLMDDCLPSAFVALNKNVKYSTNMFVHDVVPHSGSSVLKKIKRFFKYFVIEHSYKKANKIICLSDYSRKLFVKEYAKLKDKVISMRLGAHLVTTDEKKPAELHDEVFEYILFFGRIDHYKGVEFLYERYIADFSDNPIHLIIAGKPIVHVEQLEKNKHKNVHYLGRFIEDAEMNWLFSHCKLVVLPYKDSSQSGVIPIAYYYSKPVLVSNNEGLTEYLENGKTGFVYNDGGDFSSQLQKLLDMSDDMVDDISNYEKTYLDWNTNIKKVLENE